MQPRPIDPSRVLLQLQLQSSIPCHASASIKATCPEMDTLGATALHRLGGGFGGHLCSTRARRLHGALYKVLHLLDLLFVQLRLQYIFTKSIDRYLFLERLPLPRSSLAYSQPRVTRFKWLPPFEASQLTVSTVPTADITTSPEPKPALDRRTEARVARGSPQLLNRRCPFRVGIL
jgi:hypothetical protein